MNDNNNCSKRHTNMYYVFILYTLYT